METTGLGHWFPFGNPTGTTALTPFTSLVPRCFEMDEMLSPKRFATWGLYNSTAGGAASSMQVGIFDSGGTLRAKTDTLVGLTGSNQARALTFSSPSTFSGSGYIACIVTDDTSIVLIGASSGSGGHALFNLEPVKRVFTVPALGSVDFGTVNSATLGTRTAASISIPNAIVAPVERPQ